MQFLWQITIGITGKKLSIDEPSERRTLHFAIASISLSLDKFHDFPFS